MAAIDRTKSRLPRFRDALTNKKTLLIVMQDHPDPDAVAAAAALRLIANQKFLMTCSLAHGGTVGRAENRALVRYLDLNLRSVEEVDATRFDAVAMVDTQPGTGNNSLPPEVGVHVVIDHHPIRRATRSAGFTDVRRDYGATSTILYEYLRALKLQPDAPLATALCYAIRSDTQDLGRESTQADIDAYVALYPVANKRILGRIQLEPEPIEYFESLSRALRNAAVYGRCVVTTLAQVACPELVAEVADLLLRYEKADWVLVSGVYQSKLYLSMRTNDNAVDAGRVMRALVSRLGTGGGHGNSAGGQIPVEDTGESAVRRTERTVTRRLLRRLQVRDTKGRILIAGGAT